MITTNVNGNPISQGFIDEIRSDSPTTIARLWYNNAEVPCDIVDITIEKGSCGSDPFMIGEVIGDLLTATVKDLSVDIKNEVIECHIGALVNGSYEFISLGQFRVSEVKKTRYQSEITAYSSVVADTGSRLDITGLSNPTIAQIASRVAGRLNCTVTFDTGIDTSLVVGAQLEGLTYYQALQVIAICCGGYVVNTNDGNVRVKKFDTTSTLSVDTGMMVNLPEFAEQPYEVESVGVMVSEATTDNEGNPIDEVFYSNNPAYIIVTKQGADYYLEGIDKDYIITDDATLIIFRSQNADYHWTAEERLYILANLKPETADVYFSCPYMTEDIFKTNVMGIKGYTYTPATVDLTLGDPRIEGCDVLTVTDVDESTYTVPCHKVVHKYDGGFTSEITACEASDKANSIGTSFPITQRLETQSRQIGTAQATADNAYKVANDTNQYFWFTGSGSDTGAHITETPQEQFIADPQNGGGNLLARSNGVAIRDGLEELAEFTEAGVNLNQNGVSVARFGADEARVGAEGASNITMNTDGIKVQKDADNYMTVELQGMNVYQDGNISASFGSTGAQIGKDNTGHAILTASGMTIYGSDGTVELANISYGSGETTSGELADAPYFTFGTRASGSDVGNNSFAEGYRVTASGANSHAEGADTVASKQSAHAEGLQTTAEASMAHAEGQQTTAHGYASHAEGYYTFANGRYSHAGGNGTVADGESQTAVGKYNVADSSSLFIVGNGTIASRTNALTVDSSNNLRINGDLYVGCNADSSGGALLKVLKVTKSSVSSLNTTISNSAITANMECLHCVLSNPSAQTGDWTVTTSAGSAVISGSISGTTDITLYLTEPST